MASVKKIEEKFDTSQDALVLQHSDLSLKSISDMVDSGSIDISPKYQRRERWSEKKEAELIESFLLNIPVPPIYLAEDEYGTYSVIDGKQRVTAINKFLNGKLKLKDLEKFIELEQLNFEDLPLKLKNALKIRPYIRVVTLLRQSDPDLKHEVFLRLNKAGVALNAQEIRNVAYRGKFNDMLFDLSRIPYFVSQLKSEEGSKVYREMVDVQYVLRYFTVRESWQSFPGNMDFAMDQYMRDHFKSSAPQIDILKKLFHDSLDFCNTIWGNDGFLKPDGSRRVLQGFYDIQMVCPSFLTSQQRRKAIAAPQAVRNALVNLLDSDPLFLESVTQFTQNARNVYYRINTFIETIKNI